MKLNQSWIVKLLKFIISILLMYCIYKTIFQYEEELHWPKILSNNILFLIVTIFLMPLNWYVESKRWQFVMFSIGKPVLTVKSIESTIAGLTLSLITPFKLGDYFGRMLLLRSEYKKSSVYATLICSIYQNIVNVSLGMLGMYFLYQFSNGYKDQVLPLLIVNFFILLLMYLIILRIDLIMNFVLNISWIKNKISGFKLEKMTSGTKLRLLTMSLCRYSIYVSQYVLILYFLNIDNSFIELIAGITSIFLIQSAIPLPPFLSFLARAEIAVLIWKIIGLELSVALLATVLLWVINLMLPALLGLVLILYKWR